MAGWSCAGEERGMREREDGERIALWAGDHDCGRMRSGHGDGLNLD